MPSVFSSNPLSQMLPQPVLLVLSVLCLFGASQQEDCPLDAAMTIGFPRPPEQDLRYHFLFKDLKMYKVSVNWDAKSMTRVGGPINISHYWNGWNQPKVTRTWSWRNDRDYPTVWPAMIGDDQKTHLVRLDRNTMERDSNETNVWSQDSLIKGLYCVYGYELVLGVKRRMPPKSETRAIYLSVYEPGWLWVQNYFVMNEVRTYITDIQLWENSVDCRVTSIDNFYMKTDEKWKFVKNFDKQRMQLVGVFFTGWGASHDDNSMDVEMVVFVKLDGKTKHCFGYMSTSDDVYEHCAFPGNYTETDTSLFGCGEPKTTAKTTTTTTAPVAVDISETEKIADVTSETPETEEPILPTVLVIAGIAGVVLLIVAILILHFVSGKKQPSKFKKGDSKFAGSDLGGGGKTVRSVMPKSSVSGSGSGSETDTEEGSESEKETAPLLKKQPRGVKQSKSTAKSGVGAKSGVKSAVKSDVKSGAKSTVKSSIKSDVKSDVKSGAKSAVKSAVQSVASPKSSVASTPKAPGPVKSEAKQPSSKLMASDKTVPSPKTKKP